MCGIGSVQFQNQPTIDATLALNKSSSICAAYLFLELHEMEMIDLIPRAFHSCTWTLIDQDMVVFVCGVTVFVSSFLLVLANVNVTTYRYGFESVHRNITGKNKQ